MAEQGRWYTALPRPLFASAFIIYVWKVVVWDKVLGFGTTDALSGEVSQWAATVLTAYFDGRSLEKVARITGPALCGRDVYVCFESVESRHQSGVTAGRCNVSQLTRFDSGR